MQKDSELPRVASLDIETYGAATHNLKGQPLPTQKETRSNGRFNVHKSIALDAPLTLTLTVSLTWPLKQPTYDLRGLASLQPGPSMVFDLERPHHLRYLVAHLRRLDAIIGQNLPFDISYLRRSHPLLAHVLSPYTHLLIDHSVVTHLQYDLRDERSLKDLSPILGSGFYERTLTHARYSPSEWEQLRYYNAQDTHTTLVNIATLARSIAARYPKTSKLSPYSLRFFSDTIHSTLRMVDNGVPYSRPALVNLYDRYTTIIRTCNRLARRHHNYLTEGPGSKKHQTRLIDAISTAAPSLLDDPLLELTEKRGDISFSDNNRHLFATHLPPGHRLHHLLTLINVRAKHSKLRNSFLQPLLYHKSKDPTNRTSILLPQSPSPLPLSRTEETSAAAPRSRNPDTWLAHPNFYVCPSPTKDGQGDRGGTLQVRVTFQKSAEQTTPPPLQACRRSRWTNGLLVSMDLSQIELRVAALLSGEPALLRAFLDGEDLHGERAIQLFGEQHFHDKYPHVPEHLRLSRKSNPGFSSYEGQIGKMVNFADLFRSGPDTMQGQTHAKAGLLLPLSFFEKVAAQRPYDRPVLHAWQEKLISEAKTNGYLEAPYTGFSRTFLSLTKDSKYWVNEAVNFPVQATAAAVLLRIQARLDKLLPPTILPYLQVYDALKFDLKRPSLLPTLRSALNEAFAWVTEDDLWARLQTDTGHTVPLDYDLDVGKG